MPAVKREGREPDEKELVSWTAPSRPFKRRTRQFYVTLFSVAGLMALLLIIMGEFLPIVLIVSVIFLYYVMATVEPESISYAITNKGVRIHDQRADWEQMTRFWFVTRSGSDVLVVETTSLTGRLELVLAPGILEDVKKTLSNYLPYEAVSPSLVDKSSAWVSERVSTK